MGKTFEGDFCGTSLKSLTYIDTFYTKMTLWPRLTFLLPILREVPVEPTWLDLFKGKCLTMKVVIKNIMRILIRHPLVWSNNAVLMTDHALVEAMNFSLE